MRFRPRRWRREGGPGPGSPPPPPGGWPLPVAVHGLAPARAEALVGALRRAGLEPAEVDDPVGFVRSGRGRLVVVALASRADGDLVRALTEHDPPAVVVAAVPLAATPAVVRAAWGCGATAVVGATERPEEAAETVRSAARGYVRLPAGAADALF